MAKLRIPSLQHLARNWHNDSERVKKTLVRLAKKPPIFNYNPLFSAVRDMLVLKQSYDQIVEGIIRGVRKINDRNNFLEVLPLIKDHFEGVSPSFVQAVGRRYYPVARNLMIPFEPPLLYGIGSRIHFPWFSFWRTNPIIAKRLSLFVSIVDDVLLQDPDLEDAKFEILDFSKPAPDQARELNVTDAREIPRVSEKDKLEMLSTFAEGFFLAQAELAGLPESQQESKSPDEASKNEDDQLWLFDDDSLDR